MTRQWASRGGLEQGREGYISGEAMDTLRDLELLIQSRYPIIAIETFEEGRVDEVLRRTAATLDISFFIWTIADGLRHAATGQATQETKLPARALNSLREFKGEGIYLFKDLHRYLGDAETVRRLQDVARSLAGGRSAIILCAPVRPISTCLMRFASWRCLLSWSSPRMRN